jgi:hypothetical protein
VLASVRSGTGSGPLSSISTGLRRAEVRRSLGAILALNCNASHNDCPHYTVRLGSGVAGVAGGALILVRHPLQLVKPAMRAGSKRKLPLQGHWRNSHAGTLMEDYARDRVLELLGTLLVSAN